MNQKSILLRRYLGSRLSAFYAQPSDKVVGRINSGFIPQKPSGLQSCDVAKLSLQGDIKEDGKSRNFHRSGNGAASRIKLSEAIDFASLWGEWDWQRTYKKMYEQQEGMWLTPCELFVPYYSNILANFVAEVIRNSLQSPHNVNGGFEIVELGGGRGTNANALLNHLRKYHFDIYAKLDKYKILDASPTLHELQREILITGPSNEPGDCDNHPHASKIELVNTNMIDVAEEKSPFLSYSEVPTVVIALELLDNLPHDKVGRCIDTNVLLQAEVLPFSEFDCGGEEAHSFEYKKHDKIDNFKLSLEYREVFSPLNDPLLSRILAVAPMVYTPTVFHGPRWIPTVALGVLMKLFESRPNSSVAFADFDWLPPPNLGNSFTTERSGDGRVFLAEPTLGDPLVTDMDGRDHASYLTSPPDVLCDILFPTDFTLLSRFLREFCSNSDVNRRNTHDQRTPEVNVSTSKQKDFLMSYGPNEIMKTRSWITGFSPLVSDFVNCSVLTVTPNNKSPMQ